MQARAVDVQDGQAFQIEADDIHVEVVAPPGLAGDLGPSDLVDRFSSRVGELGRALATVASQLRRTLESQLAAEQDDERWGLTEVSLEMSINLEAEAGIVISRAKTGAAFQATLTWSRHEPTAPPPGSSGPAIGSAVRDPGV
jgi:hypothetical protein